MIIIVKKVSVPECPVLYRIPSRNELHNMFCCHAVVPPCFTRCNDCAKRNLFLFFFMFITEFPCIPDNGILFKFRLPLPSSPPPDFMHSVSSVEVYPVKHLCTEVPLEQVHPLESLKMINSPSPHSCQLPTVPWLSLGPAAHLPRSMLDFCLMEAAWVLGMLIPLLQAQASKQIATNEDFPDFDHWLHNEYMFE